MTETRLELWSRGSKRLAIDVDENGKVAAPYDYLAILLREAGYEYVGPSSRVRAS